LRRKPRTAAAADASASTAAGVPAAAAQGVTDAAADTTRGRLPFQPRSAKPGSAGAASRCGSIRSRRCSACTAKGKDSSPALQCAGTGGGVAKPSSKSRPARRINNTGLSKPAWQR
jgi:hypothetical protein